MNKHKETQKISDKKYWKNWSTAPCASPLYAAQSKN